MWSGIKAVLLKAGDSFRPDLIHVHICKLPLLFNKANLLHSDLAQESEQILELVTSLLPQQRDMRNGQNLLYLMGGKTSLLLRRRTSIPSPDRRLDRSFCFLW